MSRRTPGNHGKVPAARSESSDFRNLQRGLTGDRTLVGKSYMDDPGMLAAYLGYYWPASRAQCLAVLDRLDFLRSLNGDARSESPARTLIDVGSGPGPVASAFASRGTVRLSLLDQSPAALALAREKLAPGKVSTHSLDVRNPDPDRIEYWGQADCVSFGHSLNELWAGESGRIELRADLLTRYAEALIPGGYILVIEPALLETSRDLLAVRNLLVSRGWRVTGPCPGRESLPCPALAAGPAHTCHETARWSMPEETARLARSLGLDREWLKMTWFALKPPLVPVEGPASGEGNSGPQNGLFRVVSDPMLNKGGRVRKLLCGASGRFPLSAAAISGRDSGFQDYDRLERGDFIAVTGQEIRENGWGMTKDTAIVRLFPAFGKTSGKDFR